MSRGTVRSEGSCSSCGYGARAASGFPLRFIFQQPDTGAMGSLPWLLIPGFLVPLYLITHLFIFARLLGARAPRGAQSLSSVAA